MVLIIEVVLVGVFDAVPLMVKEPNGEFRPENEWTRGGEFNSDHLNQCADDACTGPASDEGHA